LYLDVDAIVLTDVTELWGADLGGAVLGAVADCYMDPQKFAARWGLQGESPGYFNSGVLLFDLERMRAGKLFEKAVAFVVANLDDVRFTDQDALNFACWSQWKRLDARWNVQRHMVISALNEETPPDRRLNGQSPAIIHYTSAEKPWLSEGYHPWAWAYWDNLQRTQFLKDVRTRYRVGLLHLFRMWARWVWRGPKQS
jgi:lipopolysaccharide biosynthesis glycosyltransferase